MNRHLLLLSSSKPRRNAAFLSHAYPLLKVFLGSKEQVLFIPYASPGGISHQAYTQLIQQAFAQLGLKQRVEGIESYNDPVKAIQQAEALFVGGGNSFLLLKTLYDKHLLDPMRERILGGLPYIGSSAGSNLMGPTLHTSNDMAIVHPPSLDALGILPFNINPHYPLEENKHHNGETRADRIREFHALPQNTQPILAMYEGSLLHLEEGKLQLIGQDDAAHPAAWLFRQGKDAPEAISHDRDVSFLMG